MVLAVADARKLFGLCNAFSPTRILMFHDVAVTCFIKPCAYKAIARNGMEEHAKMSPINLVRSPPTHMLRTLHLVR